MITITHHWPPAQEIAQEGDQKWSQRWHDFLAAAPSLADVPKLLREMSGVTAEFKKKGSKDEKEETFEKPQEKEGGNVDPKGGKQDEAEAGCVKLTLALTLVAQEVGR